jgi:AraC-like DNA-binding protein
MRTSDQALGRAPTLPTSHPNDLLPAYKVSTRDMPQSLQFEAWRDLAGAIADVELLGDRDVRFVAEQTAWDLGGVVLTHTAVPALRFRRTLRQVRSDGFDHWVLSALRSGSSRTLTAGHLVTAAAGQLNIRSLGRASEGDTAGMQAVHLFVPRDLCRDAAVVLDDPANAAVQSGLGRLLADHLFSFERRLPELTAGELPGLVQSIRAMLLVCIAPSAERMWDAHETIEATMLERARQLVQARLYSPTLGTAELCRELGVSRSGLYRMFEPLGGVVHYIRTRRLMDAHAALANASDQRPIVEIAAERGFLEAAEFSRAFKREFGYRPTDARGHSNVLPMHPPARDRDREDNLASLLRRLQ